MVLGDGSICSPERQNLSLRVAPPGKAYSYRNVIHCKRLAIPFCRVAASLLQQLDAYSQSEEHFAPQGTNM